MYKYSVIIPVYNAENTISRAINCIVNQSYDNWELILVNDGSTDGSREILESYAGIDSRIIVLNQENAGPGISRNNGIQAASGDYIAFLDADDYYDPDYLESVDIINLQGKKDYCLVHQSKQNINPVLTLDERANRRKLKNLFLYYSIKRKVKSVLGRN